uniref:Uncharacterized protein n=1 Tax=Arundo donax TaxID=35708 RepID=A0A0A9FS90_ARUDO
MSSIAYMNSINRNIEFLSNLTQNTTSQYSILDTQNTASKFSILDTQNTASQFSILA